MKIMFVHNNYAEMSGEERMIERITSLLRSHGHDVCGFFKNSDTIQSSSDKAQAFLSGVWSRSAAREFSEVLYNNRPDIIQIQNLYPLISPSVLEVARKAEIPVVMRLSNYRLFCPNGLLMTRGKICEKCAGGKEYWCLLQNCEKSLAKSAGYALRTAVARRFKHFATGVTRYYAQTNFQKDLHVREGIPSEKIDVIPNFLNYQETKLTAHNKISGDFVAFAGRLSAEKGVDFLLEVAERLPSIPFRLAGSPGPYKDRRLPENVQLCGHLRGNELAEFYQKCRLLVLPSIWYEGFPGVALDAMRSVKPIVASRLGGVPEIIEDGHTGLLCSPGNIGEFTSAIAKLWSNSDLCDTLGAAGREKLMGKFTPENYYAKLINVYDKSMRPLDN